MKIVIEIHQWIIVLNSLVIHVALLISMSCKDNALSSVSVFVRRHAPQGSPGFA